jgi:far upstream element-binding protein
LSSVVTIKQIQDQSGASLHIPKVANAESPTVRTVQITCPNPDGANLAKRLVEDVLKTKPGYSANAITGENPSSLGPQVSIQISIPDKDVGLCIGRGGCVIKYMQGSTNTRIQIPPTVQNPGDLYRVAIVYGPTMEACQQVQAMIQRIIVEQSSAGVMSGNAAIQPSMFGSSDAPHENQPGYSAEWAAYHAAQQQQLQQSQNNASLQQNQPQKHLAPANTNEYTEPFFRYAYYYGEEAARLYYGAWSPPLGTPNPYGINPIGITPIPAASATTTTVESTDDSVKATTATVTIGTSGNTDVSVSTPRETSQRHLSNLPAWMTQIE